MLRNRHPKININSIAKISSLASILELSEESLIHLADNIDLFHKQGKIQKKTNGEPRPTHDAKPKLKQAHEKIKNRILKMVEYPYFMLGGISDHKNPRNCKAHAAIHCKKKILITEDISSFYPETSYEAVKNIWQYCFNFKSNIADILARLTTYNDELPQGWKTSSYIANLALYNYEPNLVKKLEEKGFSYSRYIDDITVSSPHLISNEDKSFIISSIYGMLCSCGYSPKRTKHDISSREQPMSVTSLNVNTENPTISKKERNNIRAMVYQIEKRYVSQGQTHSYYKKWRSLYGKVNRIKSFHETKGGQLNERMCCVKPPKHFFTEAHSKK